LTASNCGMLARPEDPGSFAEAILTLAEDRKHAFTLGQNGQNAFKSTYSWESELPKLLDFYDRVLANRSAATSARDFSSSDPQLG
jgi:glycosyltransferase involved in cell wall biosynthesis